MVKDWFESLSVHDRVLCLTTVDSQIMTQIKSMQSQLLKVSRIEQGKFRMVSQYPTHSLQIQVKENNKTQTTSHGLRVSQMMTLCNS